MVPSLALAVEYQGVLHYKNVVIFGDHEQRRKRDIEKKEFGTAYGTFSDLVGVQMM
jgi:hypothetical protein